MEARPRAAKAVSRVALPVVPEDIRAVRAVTQEVEVALAVWAEPEGEASNAPQST